MSRPRIPPEVLTAAHDRRTARIAQDWQEADRLRAEIEAAGWRVVDRGNDFALEPAHPLDFTDDGRVRYGSSQGVPSRLHEPDGATATLVLLALDLDVRQLDEVLASFGPAIRADAQLVVVADDPAPGVALELEAMATTARSGAGLTEVIATSARLGPGACLNIAVRRSIGSLIVVLEPGSRATGDVIASLEEVAADPAVAAAGAAGLSGPDVRHLGPAQAGSVVALDGRCLAARRDLVARREPVDERFTTWRHLAAWWTLVLRDEGEGRPPLRVVAVDDLPIVAGPNAGGAADERDRLARRDRYRLLDRFGTRPDLFAPRSQPG